MGDRIRRCKSPGCRGWCYGDRVYCRTCRLGRADCVRDHRQRKRDRAQSDTPAATEK